jgi:crossover junction endodeoxyribonuclease RusA
MRRVSETTPPDRCDQVAFFVPGIPAPQGSKVAGITKLGRPYLRDVKSGALHSWRDTVTAGAVRALAGREPLPEGVEVRLRFDLPKPPSVTRPEPWVRPDADKLARAILDALTTAHVYNDDGQVTVLNITKTYATDNPGVHITIRRLP